jgi:hypothetical protein
MRTVSFSFVLIISAIAGATGVLVFVAPNPAYNLATLLLGLYAVHLIAIRLVQRNRADPREAKRELAHLRAELEQERAKLQAERAELEKQRAAAEQQWHLLRDMVQERVQDARQHQPVQDAHERSPAGTGAGHGRAEAPPGSGGPDLRTVVVAAPPPSAARISRGGSWRAAPSLSNALLACSHSGRRDGIV